MRAVTGNPNLKTRAEIQMEHMTMNDLVKMTLIRPFYLGFREPIVIFFTIAIVFLPAFLPAFVFGSGEVSRESGESA